VVGDDNAIAGRQPLEDRRLLEGADHALSRHDVRGKAGYSLALEEDFTARRPQEG
jgi:hypothetical protein